MQIVSLQCSWIRRLYYNYFHEWKLIPLHLKTMSFGSKYQLKNLYCSTKIFLLNGRHTFLQVLKAHRDFFSNFYGLTSIFKQKTIQCSVQFSAKNSNFLSQLFEGDSLKPWNNLKIEYNLTNETYFQWLQLKHAIPHKWKTLLNRILVISATFLSISIILLKMRKSPMLIFTY